MKKKIIILGIVICGTLCGLLATNNGNKQQKPSIDMTVNDNSAVVHDNMDVNVWSSAIFTAHVLYKTWTKTGTNSFKLISNKKLIQTRTNYCISVAFSEIENIQTEIGLSSAMPTSLNWAKDHGGIGINQYKKYLANAHTLSSKYFENNSLLRVNFWGNLEEQHGALDYDVFNYNKIDWKVVWGSTLLGGYWYPQ